MFNQFFEAIFQSHTRNHIPESPGQIKDSKLSKKTVFNLNKKEIQVIKRALLLKKPYSYIRRFFLKAGYRESDIKEVLFDHSFNINEFHTNQRTYSHRCSFAYLVAICSFFMFGVSVYTHDQSLLIISPVFFFSSLFLLFHFGHIREIFSEDGILIKAPFLILIVFPLLLVSSLIAYSIATAPPPQPISKPIKELVEIPKDYVKVKSIRIEKNLKYSWYVINLYNKHGYYIDHIDIKLKVKSNNEIMKFRMKRMDDSITINYTENEQSIEQEMSCFTEDKLLNFEKKDLKLYFTKIVGEKYNSNSFFFE